MGCRVFEISPALKGEDAEGFNFKKSQSCLASIEAQ